MSLTGKHTDFWTGFSSTPAYSRGLMNDQFSFAPAPNPDADYLNLVVSKLEICKAYLPKFGQGKSVSLEQFKALYGSDRFYTWFGLDNPMMYAAHKAAGGITSLYRQIGIGCEYLFRQVVRDQLGLTAEQATWSYKIPTIVRGKQKERELSLDGRIQFHDIQGHERLKHFSGWMEEAGKKLQIAPEIGKSLKGAVFEVRQGYKSKDSKRQNADLGNAGTAYKNAYLPVVAVLSSQIDRGIAMRYEQAGWLLLRGTSEQSTVHSVYAFSEEVLGYDLAGFFERNTDILKSKVEEVLEALLSPETPVDGAALAELEKDQIETSEVEGEL